MKVAQKQRGTARFRRYELVSVSKFRNGGAIPPVSEGLFWCLVFDMFLAQFDLKENQSSSLRRLGAMRAAEPAALPNGRDRIICGDP
jgi:hypothetical protein